MKIPSKINCEKCDTLLASKGFVNRDFTGYYVKCNSCDTDLKGECYSINLSEYQITIVCKKCFKKALKAGLKCYKCIKNNNVKTLD